MDHSSIIRSKIRELEEASLEAANEGKPELVSMYTRELVPLLLRLVNVIGSAKSD